MLPASAKPSPKSTERALSPLRSSAKLRRISQSFYVLEDTCNVYAICEGRHAILIDFGSGAILHHLSELGVENVDWILHTHHHRDQAQGDVDAAERGIPIAVPEYERRYFVDAEDFWRNRRVFDLHLTRNDFFSLTENVPVNAVLRDYESFEWRGRSLYILPTPGHTPGSISLLTEIDGLMTAFTGDLLQARGQIQNLYSLQYMYDQHEGADLSVYSLQSLIRKKPQLVCPSHGGEMSDPIPVLEETSQKLGEWSKFWSTWGFSTGNELRQLTPHLVASYQTMCSFYAVISDSGKALLVDYGLPGWNAFFTYRDHNVDIYARMRFLEHSLEELQSKHGVKSFAVAIASHMHDDHVAGFPYLKKHHGTEIWLFENFVDILQNPAGRNLGCALGEEVRADRVIRNRETFRWEEFTFTAVHSPGHTKYQMALFSTIDGVNIGFTGDAFFHDAERPFQIRHNLIYRNRVDLGDHLQSAANLIEFKPHILCPGHGEPFALDLDMVRDFQRKLEKQDALCRSLIADRDADLGMDPSWVELYPYQSLLKPGETREYELRVRNHRQRPIDIQAALVLPPGWVCAPGLARISVDARGEGRARLSISIPHNFRPKQQRTAIAVDVSEDGRYLGQIAEAFIDVHTAELSAAAKLPSGF